MLGRSVEDLANAVHTRGIVVAGPEVFLYMLDRVDTQTVDW